MKPKRDEVRNRHHETRKKTKRLLDQFSTKNDI